MILVATETVTGAVHLSGTCFEVDGVDRVPIASLDEWKDCEGEYGVNAVFDAIRRVVMSH